MGNLCRLQPNLDTRKKQIEAWTSFILDYNKHHKQLTLDVVESQTSALFFNKAINRKLSLEAIYTVLEELQKKGNVEWTDKSRKQCLVMWRTPVEWAKLIYQWVTNNGMNNSVCTLYELTNGEDTEKEEFHGLESWMLIRALKVLEQQRKAEIMEGSEGVKFF